MKSTVYSYAEAGCTTDSHQTVHQRCIEVLFWTNAERAVHQRHNWLSQLHWFDVEYFNCVNSLVLLMSRRVRFTALDVILVAALPPSLLFWYITSGFYCLLFRCWLRDSPLQWIVSGPIVFTLAVSRLLHFYSQESYVLFKQQLYRTNCSVHIST